MEVKKARIQAAGFKSQLHPLRSMESLATYSRLWADLVLL